MYKDRKIVAIIPARGGSKGLPGKNIKELAGKPLLAWSILQAKNSKYLDRAIVSTDDLEIALVAREHGGDVPFMRPPELAHDDSTTASVILHALDYLEKLKQTFDYVCLIEPTSPLRKWDDIDQAIRQVVENEDAETLVTVGEIHTEHPMIVKKITGNHVVPYMENTRKIHQRQQADMAYFPYGVIYISKVEAFREKQTFYTNRTLPMNIERWQNYEIDDEIDFELVEMLVEKFMDRIIRK